MARRAFVAAVTVLALLVATPQAPVVTPQLAADLTTGHLVPVPTSAPYQISTELNYSAFPYTVKTAAGTYLCSYKAAPSHNSHTSTLVHRRSTDGVAWEGPYSMPGQSAGYTWGHGGIGVETAAQGSRVYLLLLRLHWSSPTSTTVDEVRSWIKWSDDDGLTWELGPMFPPIVGVGWYPSSLLVLQDGSLLAAGYNSDGWVRYQRSTDRGATWSLAGAAKPSDRGVAEGTLAQLDDGRVISFLRSDVPSERLYWTITSDEATWSDPVVASYDASGLPNPTVLPGGHVAVLYRGYADATNPALGRPTRMLMFTVTETGLSGYRGGIDPWPFQRARYLYGNVIPGRSPGSYLAIIGAEGVGGQTGGYAAVVALPMEFRTI